MNIYLNEVTTQLALRVIELKRENSSNYSDYQEHETTELDKLCDVTDARIEELEKVLALLNEIKE